MKLLCAAVAVLAVVLFWKCEQSEASKKSSVRVVTYPKHNYYYYKHYKYKYPYYKRRKTIKWPKIRGRCKVVRDITLNGTNPILDATRKGNVVVVFLSKRKCKFCLQQLEYLNDLSEYFRETERKVKFIVVNHKKQPLPEKIYRAYPYLDIYEEPVDKDIFGQLRGGWKQVLIFDVCGRQQYHYGWPYSWLGYPFVRQAVLNTISYHIKFCGKCNETVTTNAPKVTPTTNHVVTFKETNPPTKIKNIDGPFTQN